MTFDWLHISYPVIMKNAQYYNRKRLMKYQVNQLIFKEIKTKTYSVGANFNYKIWLDDAQKLVNNLLQKKLLWY